MAKQNKNTYRSNESVTIKAEGHRVVRAAKAVRKLIRPGRQESAEDLDKIADLLTRVREHSDAATGPRHDAQTVLEENGFTHNPAFGRVAELASRSKLEAPRLGELLPGATVGDLPVKEVLVSRSTRVDASDPARTAQDRLSVYVKTEGDRDESYLWCLVWHGDSPDAAFDGYIYQPGPEGPDVQTPISDPAVLEARRAEVFGLLQVYAGNLTKPQPQPTH